MKSESLHTQNTTIEAQTLNGASSTYSNAAYCDKCGKIREFKPYSGCLGYESFICSVCGTDINDYEDNYCNNPACLKPDCDGSCSLNATEVLNKCGDYFNASESISDILAKQKLKEQMKGGIENETKI